ncbi:transcription antitermination protein NusB [Mycoplasmopsis glycophila]|uniref:Transcription termination factor n=1 Tax=Mycoplasmopsis glycophila TaxID=171285 RepID=A0A449AUS4_9BACT|nr:transcription antitermination protein NusB [Mycoplasmopsis glycophila]VEU70222.1 transcription termination factor [Mycoplasmopsis glycophila]
MNTKSRRQKRVEIIQVLYKYELLEREINIQDVFDEFPFLDKEQLVAIDKIAKSYNVLKKSLSKFINPSWKWERISPVVRAILLNGAYELFFIQPRIVINEAVEITKNYFWKPIEPINKDERIYDDWQYKFVNGILENYYKLLLKLEQISYKVEE